MRKNPNPFLIEFVLRTTISGCFIGHGYFGIVGKTAWLPYFGVFGINPAAAFHLMPIIGTMDILVGFCAFIFPSRVLILWALFWTIFTALLRPLAHEGVWEFFERAGNYGIPLALLCLSSGGSRKTFLSVLRISLFLILVGHGALIAIQEKPILFNLYHLAGSSQHFTLTIGFAEIALGFLSIIYTSPGFFIFILGWKIFSELLYPLSGASIFEFVERAGSYGVPFLLFVVSSWQMRRENRPSTVETHGEEEQRFNGLTQSRLTPEFQ